MRARTAGAVALAVGLMTLAAGCGTDDGAGVRGPGSASASGAGGSGTADAPCSPVGEDLEDDATQTIDVALLDFAFDPDDIEADEGVVTFVAENGGSQNHELAFLPGGGEVPFTEDGVPDEEALADAGAFELEGFGPEQTCNATYELDAGDYTLFCIIEADDGETHYEKGMAGTLTVT